MFQGQHILIYDENEEIELVKRLDDPTTTLCQCLWYLMENRKAVDRVAKQYDVETQRASSGAKPKRARYNSSIMDANAILRKRLVLGWFVS